MNDITEECNDTRYGKLVIKAIHGRYARKSLYDLKESIEYVLHFYNINATKRLIQSIRIDERIGALIIDTPYAYYLETGSVPHKPNYACLVKWAVYKFGMGYTEAKRFAWNVYNNIRMFGTSPSLYLTRALSLSELEKISVLQISRHSYIMYVRRIK